MIIKLTDIVTVMKDKWTYGDKFFGFTEEFNDNHNTQYPSLLITPPDSLFPEVGVNNGWENYTFEIYFSDLYNRTAQANESIDQRWENLQDLATEWLDMFLKHYQSNAPVQAFLEDESLTIQRNKEVANDQLLQIRMTFTWRVFSKCFRPQSTYPNQINNLAVWLSADSNLTFKKATKRISNVGDRSGNNNNVSQATADNQPLRYSYDGANDKTRMEFDGTNDYLKSDSTSPISNTEFTVFTVAQADKVTPTFTNDYSTMFEYTGGDAVDCGNPLTGIATRPQMFSFTDGAGTDKPFTLSFWAFIDPAQNPQASQPWRGFLTKGDGATNEWAFQTVYSNGYYRFRLYDDSSGGHIGRKVNESLPKGEWIHLTSTYDGSGSDTGINLYLNGNLLTTLADNSGAYSGMELTNESFEIGKGPNSMSGNIDEVAVFDTQLDATDVSNIYNNGNPTDLSTHSKSANMIGWWRMGDGATFPTIPDETANNNDGTMIGSMTADNIVKFSPTSQKGDYFSYSSGNVLISLGSNSSRPYFRVNDTTAFPYAGEWNVRVNKESVNNTNNYHILTAFLSSTNLSLQTNNNTAQNEIIDSGWSSPTFNDTNFNIGSGINLGDLKGNIQEVIVYNRALNSYEIAKVKDYLNKKYKIY